MLTGLFSSQVIRKLHYFKTAQLLTQKILMIKFFHKNINPSERHKLFGINRIGDKQKKLRDISANSVY